MNDRKKGRNPRRARAPRPEAPPPQVTAVPQATTARSTPKPRRVAGGAFDPNTLIAAARTTFAPALEAQHEGFRSFERLTRLQYALAGDVLESGLARLNAGFAATSPIQLFQRHTELNRQLADTLRARAGEFARVSAEIQAKLTRFSSDLVAKTVSIAKSA